MVEKIDFDAVLLWLLALLGSMAMCGAKLGFLLYRLESEPPVDPVALDLWKRKRRWLVISEFSALPAFATVALVVGRLSVWPPEGVVLMSMVLGALGFAFFLDALQTVVRNRIGMDGAAKDSAS